MPRPSGNLQSRIEALAARFAHDVVAALRTVPLSEIAQLAGATMAPAPGRRASAGRGSQPAAETAAPARRKRKVVNYPKCAWAGCGKNRSPRTLPFCGEHFRAARNGESPPAGTLGTGVTALASRARAPKSGKKSSAQKRAA